MKWIGDEAVRVPEYVSEPGNLLPEAIQQCPGVQSPGLVVELAAIGVVLQTQAIGHDCGDHGAAAGAADAFDFNVIALQQLIDDTPHICCVRTAALQRKHDFLLFTFHCFFFGDA